MSNYPCSVCNKDIKAGKISFFGVEGVLSCFHHFRDKDNDLLNKFMGTKDVDYWSDLNKLTLVIDKIHEGHKLSINLLTTGKGMWYCTIRYNAWSEGQDRDIDVYNGGTLPIPPSSVIARSCAEAIKGFS